MLTLRLNKELENQVTTTASLLGISKSELIRISVTEYIQKQQKPNAWELGRELFGKHSSGKGDLSTNRKTLIKEKIKAKHQR